MNSGSNVIYKEGGVLRVQRFGSGNIGIEIKKDGASAVENVKVFRVAIQRSGCPILPVIPRSDEVTTWESPQIRLWRLPRAFSKPSQ